MDPPFFFHYCYYYCDYDENSILDTTRKEWKTKEKVKGIYLDLSSLLCAQSMTLFSFSSLTADRFLNEGERAERATRPAGGDDLFWRQRGGEIRRSLWTSLIVLSMPSFSFLSLSFLYFYLILFGLKLNRKRATTEWRHCGTPESHWRCHVTRSSSTI